MQDEPVDDLKPKAEYVKPEMKTYSEDDLKDLFPEVYAASAAFSDLWTAIATP